MANSLVDSTEKLSLFSEHWSPKVVLTGAYGQDHLVELRADRPA